MVNWKAERVFRCWGIASITIRLSERPWISKFEIGGGNKIAHFILYLLSFSRIIQIYMAIELCSASCYEPSYLSVSLGVGVLHWYVFLLYFNVMKQTLIGIIEWYQC